MRDGSKKTSLTPISLSACVCVCATHYVMSKINQRGGKMEKRAKETQNERKGKVCSDLHPTVIFSINKIADSPSHISSSISDCLYMRTYTYLYCTDKDNGC
jgi:hypothetical protein